VPLWGYLVVGQDNTMVEGGCQQLDEARKIY
jgi:hypothetical protein